MPVRMVLRNWSDSGLSPVYYEPVAGQTLNPSVLSAMRAEYGRERDAMLDLQKAATDRDTARFFKGEATHYLKLWRAADAWFRWASGETGWRPISTWPCELAAAFDFIHGRATTAA